MVVARDGIPSWSYSHVEDDLAERKHALDPRGLTGPVTVMDWTGVLWPAAVVNTSTYTVWAIPWVMTAPDPTRTTAMLFEENAVCERQTGKRARSRIRV